MATTLNVQAIALKNLAAANNSNPITIVLSVMDNSGNGVTLLQAAQFQVANELVPTGANKGTHDRVTRASGQFAGTYVLQVPPRLAAFQAETWRSGTYVFSIDIPVAGVGVGIALVTLQI